MPLPNGGDYNATTGIAKRLLDQWTGDGTRNGFISPLGDAVEFVKSLAYAVGKAVADEMVAGNEGWRYVGAFNQPVFLNGHANNTASIHAPSRFRLRLDNSVDLELATGGGASGSIVFVLPAGYRPAWNRQVASWNVGSVIRWEIRPSGEVVVHYSGGAAPNLLTLNFPAEQ